MVPRNNPSLPLVSLPHRTNLPGPGTNRMFVSSALRRPGQRVGCEGRTRDDAMTHGRTVGLFLALFAFATMGAAAARPEPPVSEARLKQIVKFFAEEDAEKGAAALRKAGLPQVLPLLQRLQRKTPKDQELYIDLAFALAYFGVDYQLNVRRLAALDELWNRGDPSWQQYVSDGNDMRDSIPDLMSTLYEHNHDPGLLRTLFSWGLDGGPAEVLDVGRVQLLTAFPLQVLRVTRHSADREEGAIRSLSDEVGADEAEYRRATRSVRRASRRADPVLRRYIHRFLQRAGARWKISQEERDLRGADLSKMAGLAGMDLRNLDLRGADLRQPIWNTLTCGARSCRAPACTVPAITAARVGPEGSTRGNTGP
jgi:hypothetical protein